MASLGGQATVNSGLAGTVRFRTTAGFSGTEIRLVRAELSRGGRFETITPNIRIALQAPPPANFSLSLDVDGSAGDQTVTSADVSTDEIIAIQIFGKDIQNANGLSVRFEYDASQIDCTRALITGDVYPMPRHCHQQGHRLMSKLASHLWVVRLQLTAVWLAQYAFVQRLGFQALRFGWCVQNSVEEGNLRPSP